MELTVLGCGDAFGNGGRNHTSFLLTHNGEHILMDCGASTLIRLKQEGIELESISTIVLSHFHGDHYGGVPFFLISSMFETPRQCPLTIVGPKGVESKVLQLLEAMYAGTSEKLKDLDIQFVEFESGNEIEVNNLSIMSHEVEHSPPSFPHGYRIEWGGKKVAFSGDTSWSENLVKLADQTDLFICECNFMNGVSFGHLSVEELNEKAQLLNTKKLWLTHMADEVFDNPSVTFNKLHDGLKFTI